MEQPGLRTYVPPWMPFVLPGFTLDATPDPGGPPVGSTFFWGDPPDAAPRLAAVAVRVPSGPERVIRHHIAIRSEDLAAGRLERWQSVWVDVDG